MGKVAIVDWDAHHGNGTQDMCYKDDSGSIDPLAGIELTADRFSTLTDIILEVAEETASGRVVSALEGSYSLEAVSKSAVVHGARLGKW